MIFLPCSQVVVNFKPDNIKSEKFESLMSQGAKYASQKLSSQSDERGELPTATPAANKKVEALGARAEMLNPDTKLYIISYTKFLKPKLVNKTSSLETNEHN